MNYKILSFLIIISINTFGQDRINSSLKDELIKIDHTDQKIRKIYFIPTILDSKTDSIALSNNIDKHQVKSFLEKEMNKIDSINISKIDSIIKEHGYPGNDLVGNNNSSIAWQVIQHSKNPKKYLNLLKQAVDDKQLDFKYYALTLDKSLVYDKKPQIYGTQFFQVKLKSTDKAELILWPIEDIKNVNKLRKKADFKSTIKKYAKDSKVKFKHYTLDDFY
ncbi:DUF6624 domain-containing protein [Empedobacter sp.]|uniref:DUF6624 domain-containing protein n=1 Tax=Empedobacter sp. TaxID=1927715 RepID=UPI00289F9E2A|nr:DUF6624 domain-containing protein [Empedobacter sp.]